MAGIINVALTQQLDLNGQPLAGALLYLYAVGTVSTPQNSYSDFGLTVLNPNPLPTDQYGRIPMFYLADGQVHARLTDSSGVVIFDYPSLQVVGPSSGGGGGGGSGVDPTTVSSTGDTKWRPTAESLTGWVKINGQTIGSATSGATQRANVDTQALYVYLWNNFSQTHCAVAGGRGSNGLADFQANKTIGLPDLRGRAPFGLDDMGGAAAGRILSGNVTSGGSDGPTTPAASGGEGNHVLAISELAAHTHVVDFSDPGHAHPPQSGHFFGGIDGTVAGGTGAIGNTNAGALTGNVSTGISVALENTGSNTAHNNMSPFLLGTFFMKL